MRRRLPSWVPSITVAVAVFAALPLIGYFRAPDREEIDTQVQTGTHTNANSVSVDWTHGADGTSANAQEHWEKHGREFREDHSAADYENQAENFVHHPPAGAQFKHRSNGDTLIYDPATNTFAVEDRRGRPRTMFRPDRGRSYWDRQ